MLAFLIKYKRAKSMHKKVTKSIQNGDEKEYKEQLKYQQRHQRWQTQAKNNRRLQRWNKFLMSFIASKYTL